MTVVHIAYKYGLCNTGGAAIAATRLHQALLARGVDSHYVCILKYEDGPNVHVLPESGWRRCLFFALTKLTRGLWKFTPYRKSIPLNLVPLFGLKKLLTELKPDVVHVQWINADVCSFEQLACLPYKIVFNLHDLYLINVDKAYPGNDRRYIDGLTIENSSWIERWLVGRKRKMIERKCKSFIGPSEWVCSICRQSVVGRGMPAIAIPNIIDERFFRPLDETSLQEMSDKFVILFGAYGGRSGRLKGFSDLCGALKLLPLAVKQNSLLYIFGESAETCRIEGVETHFLGAIHSVDRMTQIYRDAGLFAFPSREETQGMTKVEALLCGVPVVAFDRTACAEGIEHGFSGWIASDGSADGFEKGIESFYHMWRSGTLVKQRQLIARQAQEQFSAESITKRVLSIYG